MVLFTLICSSNVWSRCECNQLKSNWWLYKWNSFFKEFHTVLSISFTLVSNFCARSSVISNFLHYRTIWAEFSRKVMYQRKPPLKIDFMNWPGNWLILQTGLLGWQHRSHPLEQFSWPLNYCMKPRKISSSLSVFSLALFNLLMHAASIIQNLFSKMHYCESLMLPH